MNCVIHCIDEWTIDKAKEEVERYRYPWAEPIGIVKRGKVRYRIDTMDGAWVQWKPVLSARRGLAGTVYKTPKGLHNVPSGAVAARWEDSYGRERISWFVV